jgi:hypothetical protein
MWRYLSGGQRLQEIQITLSINTRNKEMQLLCDGCNNFKTTFQNMLYYGFKKSLKLISDIPQQYTLSHKVKGTSISLQAWTCPWGSRRLRLPDFMTIGT